ncbi:uncharacterized protein LOC129886435 isoform X2 [Solanum dulcamara]|nr:uncharacterized protein LOC129886435 isoform X2 [Solanum dulcamara]
MSFCYSRSWFSLCKLIFYSSILIKIFYLCCQHDNATSQSWAIARLIGNSITDRASATAVDRSSLLQSSSETRVSTWRFWIISVSFSMDDPSFAF